MSSGLIDRRTARLSQGLTVAGSVLLMAGLALWAVGGPGRVILPSAAAATWLVTVALLTAGASCALLMITILITAGGGSRAGDRAAWEEPGDDGQPGAPGTEVYGQPGPPGTGVYTLTGRGYPTPGDHAAAVYPAQDVAVYPAQDVAVYPAQEAGPGRRGPADSGFDVWTRAPQAAAPGSPPVRPATGGAGEGCPGPAADPPGPAGPDSAADLPVPAEPGSMDHLPAVASPASLTDGWGSASPAGPPDGHLDMPQDGLKKPPVWWRAVRHLGSSRPHGLDEDWLRSLRGPQSPPAHRGYPGSGD